MDRVSDERLAEIAEASKAPPRPSTEEGAAIVGELIARRRKEATEGQQPALAGGEAPDLLRRAAACIQQLLDRGGLGNEGHEGRNKTFDSGRDLVIELVKAANAPAKLTDLLAVTNAPRGPWTCQACGGLALGNAPQEVKPPVVDPRHAPALRQIEHALSIGAVVTVHARECRRLCKEALVVAQTLLANVAPGSDKSAFRQPAPAAGSTPAAPVGAAPCAARVCVCALCDEDAATSDGLCGRCDLAGCTSIRDRHSRGVAPAAPASTTPPSAAPKDGDSKETQ